MSFIWARGLRSALTSARDQTIRCLWENDSRGLKKKKKWSESQSDVSPGTNNCGLCCIYRPVRRDLTSDMNSKVYRGNTHTLTRTDTHTHGYRTNTRSSSSPQALHGRWLHKHRHRTDDITDPQQPVNKAPPADRAEASGATLKSNSSRWETAPHLWWMELKWT